jgi:hypothetical protein
MLFAFNGRATRNFLLLLVVMQFILFVDRVNLAAAAGSIQKDLLLTNIQLGIAFSAFNYAYAPFQLVGGWFADRFGARRTLTVCGLAWSITTIATAAITGLGSLFAVRFVLGMGEGATLPAATRALSKWTSLEARGTAVGITHAAGRLGAGASAPIVALLITWFSWRFSFVALGIVSAFWAALWWWYFHEDPRRHPGITSAELAALPAAVSPSQSGSGPVPWRRLVPRVAPLMIIYFCQGWTGWLYVTWMPSLFQRNYGLPVLRGDAVERDVRGVSRRRRHRLCAAPHPQPADCSVAADRRQLDPRRRGADPGDTRPRPDRRLGRLYDRLVLSRLCDFAAVDRDDGHSPQLRRFFERSDECRGCGRRDIFAGSIRLDSDADGQLDDAVRLLRRPAAVCDCHDLLDPAGSPDQRLAAGRPAGGGRRLGGGANGRMRSAPPSAKIA